MKAAKCSHCGELLSLDDAKKAVDRERIKKERLEHYSKKPRAVFCSSMHLSTLPRMM